MYLFTRSGRFAPGASREVVSYVGEVTEKARQETGMDIHAWSSTLSADLGTVVWATFADDLEHLEQANDKLTMSDSFIDLADRGAGLFTGPLSDTVAQVVAGEVDPSTPVPNYVFVGPGGSRQRAAARRTGRRRGGRRGIDPDHRRPDAVPRRLHRCLRRLRMEQWLRRHRPA